MRYASTTVLPPRTVHSEGFFVNKQNSKTRFYIPKDAVCSLAMQRIAPNSILATDGLQAPSHNTIQRLASLFEHQDPEEIPVGYVHVGNR